MSDHEGFTDEEWETVREGPAVAGLMVVTADAGGTLRETFALARAYADARKEHGASALIDELASKGPPRGRRFKSEEELREDGPDLLREAAGLVDRRGAEDAKSYREFVLSVADRVARAHKEQGEEISPREQEAIDAIAQSLGPSE
ncbi:MAG TPA: hypothetical protein VKB73_08355 [Gaiellaceae bacterium]|nr:hypothetical protein [Gaiellaceae bacterium]